MLACPACLPRPPWPASLHRPACPNPPPAEFLYLCATVRAPELSPAVAFHTLGCKLNFSETSTLSRMLRQEGFRAVPFEEPANVYVINTCSVTEHADRKCRSIVRQALRRAPDAFVVVVGCYAQLKPAEIAGIPGVDLVLGAAEKFRLAEILRQKLAEAKNDAANANNALIPKTAQGEYRCGDIGDLHQFTATWSHGDRTRTFLKVQDGCDYSCSFCTIPLARGQSRSESVARAVERARLLRAEGMREIVLTGINLGDFGLAPGPRPAVGALARLATFLDLIQALDQIPDEEPAPMDDAGANSTLIPTPYERTGALRFRISSIEPNLLHPEIVEFMATSRRFVPHYHIPLQSGSDRILGLMKRRYRRSLYADRVALIRQWMPDAAIGVDLIVGFPGESQAEFQESYRFVQELAVDYLHVFPYSERDNTLAAQLPDPVDQGERMNRSRQLQGLSVKKRRAFHERCAGQTRPVLFELADLHGEMHGFTDNYVKVRAPYDPALAGTIVNVTLGQPDADGVSTGIFADLTGENALQNSERQRDDAQALRTILYPNI
ncbi:MAG: radical SAM protein [Bacteroidetes bacterium]|nr:radical SAM protein [Bacteroidota bacterium]